MRYERVDVAGVPVDVVSEADVLEFVRARIASRQVSRIVTVNAEFVVRAQADPEFAAAIRSADLRTPDSAGIVWALRRAGCTVDARVGGADLIWSVSGQAASLGHRVFLLGGAPGVAEAAASSLQRSFPALQIAGTCAGSPSRDEEPSIVDLIRRSGADILLVAFGAPQQDVWIARNLATTGAIIGMGVGGSFDYVAGRVPRAPLWMRRRGLEWLWRLVRQPWRWRRILALPVFVWLVWRGDAQGRKDK